MRSKRDSQDLVSAGLAAAVEHWEERARKAEARMAELESELAKVQDADDQLIQRLIAAHKVGYEMGLESKSVDQSGDGEPLAKGIPEDDYRKALSKLGEEKSNGN